MPVQFNIAGPSGVPSSALVGTTSQQIIAANQQRKWLVIYNAGAQDAYLALGQAAVIGKGIFLAKNVGKFVIDPVVFSNESVHAIAALGTAVISWIQASRKGN